jgi:hypothetical protein
MRRPIRLLLALVTIPLLIVPTGATHGNDDRNRHGAGNDESGARALERIDHIVVIYQENWPFRASAASKSTRRAAAIALISHRR